MQCEKTNEISIQIHFAIVVDVFVMMEFCCKINTDGEIKIYLEINDKLCWREFNLKRAVFRVARCSDANKTRYKISRVSVESEMLRE